MVRGLENVEVPEGGEALFECQLSRPEVAAHTWLLDDQPVLSSENAEVVYFENGLRHLLLLKNLRPQDSCRVTFLAGDVVTSAFLTVRGGYAGGGLCHPSHWILCRRDEKGLSWACRLGRSLRPFPLWGRGGAMCL